MVFLLFLVLEDGDDVRDFDVEAEVGLDLGVVGAFVGVCGVGVEGLGGLSLVGLFDAEVEGDGEGPSAGVELPEVPFEFEGVGGVEGVFVFAFLSTGAEETTTFP